MTRDAEFPKGKPERVIPVEAAADLLGIKKGEIPAQKVGKTFFIDKSFVKDITGEEVSDDMKKLVYKCVDKIIKDYGETLKLLAKE